MFTPSGGGAALFFFRFFFALAAGGSRRAALRRGAHRDDGGSPRRARREDAGEAHQREARRRNEGGDAGQTLHGRHDEVGRPILPGLAQEVRDAAVFEDREALEAEGRPCAVAAEALEPLAIAGLHDDASVDIEAVLLGDPRALCDAAMGVLLGVAGALAEPQEGAAEEGQLHARFERRELGGLVGALLRGAVVEELRRFSHLVMRAATRPATASMSSREGARPAWKVTAPASALVETRHRARRRESERSNPVSR